MFTTNPGNAKNDQKKESSTMSQKFFRACLLIFGGILLLAFAVELLAKIWIWIVLAALLIVGGIVAYRVWQARRNRW